VVLRKVPRRMGSWGKRLLACCAVAAVVLGLSAGVASASTGGCDAGWDLCLYAGQQYENVSDLVSGLTGSPDISGTQVQSIVNNTDSRWCFYSGTGYTGTTFEIHGYDTWATLPSWINDQIQSFAPGPCPTVTGPVYGYQGQCMDLEDGTVADHQKVNLQGCESGSAQQQWIVSTGSNWHIIQTGENGDYCLGARKGGDADGTLVDLYWCNGTLDQLWLYNSSTGQVMDNAQNSSGQNMCLDDTNGSTSGAQLQIWACTSGDANQQFWFPS
jgi:hypothetical protein